MNDKGKDTLDWGEEIDLHCLNNGTLHYSGPTLWNILYDGVLHLEIPDKCETLVYADDLAILVSGVTANEIS